ncbi:MAG: zinc dependent phospholipase C family protein [Oscillospiraceae bacterium]|nr:zinc dependent phospholipase C family protein [Oscillospiraceae bacterium]
MATWIVHLRISDEFIKSGLIPKKYTKEFVLGSVAPDCGYGKKDSYGDFVPPPEVTHWAPGGIKLYCEYWKFLDAYLKDRERDGDYYFYLGYYIHLITDIMWSTIMYLPTKITYADEYEENPDFLKIIKVDWYDLDFKFLRDHPDFKPYKILKETTSCKDYLPYYEPGQLTVQIKFIADYYSSSEGRELDRDYPYLDEVTMNRFIRCAAELVEFDITRKNLI